MVLNSTRRKIAFCVSNWSAEATLYSWTYLRQYILRKQQDSTGVTKLHPADELYIVHVHGAKQGAGNRSSAWQAGGALMHSLQDSLESIPHTIVELTGSNVTAAVLDWAESSGPIDIVVMGFRDARVRAAMTKVIPGDWGLGSVSGRTLQHTRVPLLIVRPDAALKLNKLRFQSTTNSGAGTASQTKEQAAAGKTSPARTAAPTTLLRTLSPGRLATYVPGEARKIGLAFEQESAGWYLLQWAATHLLQQTDQVYVVCVTTRQSVSGSAPGTEPALTAVSSPTKADEQQPASPTSPKSDEEAPATGDPLAGFDIVRNTRVQGDPREKICAFASEEGLDLLVVGRSLGSRFKKAFTPGGTVSQYVVSNASCPVLVYPARAQELSAGEQLGPQDVQGSSEQQSHRRSGVLAAMSLPNVGSQLVASFGRHADHGPARAAGHAPAPAPALAKDAAASEEVVRLRDLLAQRDAEIVALKEQVRQLRLQAPQPVALGLADAGTS